MSDLVYLAHHGVKGQKHGVRQWQNLDGSLTPAGRIHYGVGAARKKVVETAKSVGKIVKSAPKNAKSKINKTLSELKSDRKASKEASHKRRRQIKAERAAYKEQRRKEKAEDLARKIAARESKKTLNELKAEFDEALMNDSRRRIARLLEKQERIKEKAFLKEQERQLKRSMKDVKRTAKKDARERFTAKDIKNLTDEELKARTNRLKDEIALRKLEAERDAPAVSAGMDFMGDFAKKMGNAAVDGIAGTVRVAIGSSMVRQLKDSGLSQEEINEYLRWTKKK